MPTSNGTRPVSYGARQILELWVLSLAAEAIARDEIASTDVIRALTGGQDSFCPQGHTTEQLHKAGAAFLRIARL